MLFAAILLAVVGFAALVVSLAVGSTTWAWVCVVVAAIGVALFAYDLLRHRKRSRRSK
ncbi:hypothetical protein ACKFRT_04775 [Corynebacterium sp. YSMAA1_1_F7]|uniref:hypothetical protein n=1 Tax=Corynebacterium sp. YSMAA1_1_F7 TaxID=3383590 RepID=UPI0025E7E971|nr:hypothetical protein [uncultured Corynebacterium sp.]